MTSPRLHHVLQLMTLLALAAGCRPQEPTRYEVHGRVTFDGKPIPLGKIVFSSNPSAGFTGVDGWAPISDGAFDTDSGGYKTAGGNLVARLEGRGPPSERFPEGKPLFSNYDVPVVVPKARTELNFEVPRSAADGAVGCHPSIRHSVVGTVRYPDGPPVPEVRFSSTATATSAAPRPPRTR
jgi:hypothetical protein